MAFYDDMQDVATELLTEFGKVLTFERVTKTFNKITGKDTARTVAEFSTVGVEIPINQRLVDGTRIQSGDRFIIVDSSYAPAMGDRLQDSPFVSCAFTLAHLPLYGMAPDINGQIVSKAISSIGEFGNYIAGATPIDIWPSGVRVVEGRTTTGLGQNSLIVSNSDASKILLAGYIGGNQWAFRLMEGFVITEQATVSGSLSSIPALAVDASSRNCYAYLDGIQVTSGPFAPLGLAEGWMTGASLILAADISLQYIGSGDMEIVSAGSDMAFKYGEATDFCGNPVGYPEISDAWSIIDIQPIKPADTVIAYRLQVRK